MLDGLFKNCTGISHAHSASGRWQWTDCGFEDTSGLCDWQSWTTIFVCNGSDTNKLEFNCCWSWVWCLSPTWSDGSATGDESWSKSNWANETWLNNWVDGLNDWDVVVQCDWWVSFVINDTRDSHGDATVDSVLCGNNNDHVSTITIDCAMSGWSNPTVVDDEASTEMSVGQRSQWSLVWELSGCGSWSAYNTSWPGQEIWVQCSIGNG